jgi:hypothetical protein
MALDHEGLDVYQLALDFLVVANGIIEGLAAARPGRLGGMARWVYCRLPLGARFVRLQ